MKSLLLAPALVSLVQPDIVVESVETEMPIPLVAIAVVDDPPLVELAPDPGAVPVAGNQDEEARVQNLRQDLEGIAANLMAAQRAVETMAEQRDQARGEVSALTRANHEMLQEMKVFREEMETARREAADWKAQAAAFEAQVNDEPGLPAEIRGFRAEMARVMQEFRTMKDEIALVRQELQDPIERANLKEQLAESKAREERLGTEIEMALIAREKTILEAARARKDEEARITELTVEVQRAVELRDELRSTRAAQMKALVDVEILKKQLGRSKDMQDQAVAELQEARESLQSLQAEKVATAEARMLAGLERDQAQAEAEELSGQIAGVRAEAEVSRETVAQLAMELEETEVARQETEEARQKTEEARQKTEEAHQETGKQLEIASGELDKTKGEVVFLNKAKGGLEELLFRKTAEIRKLKGDLRKLHASRDKPDPPAGRKGGAPSREPGEPPPATARAD
jgi:chromosome segregation ATPase